jgi:hypothetical protein
MLTTKTILAIAALATASYAAPGIVIDKSGVAHGGAAEDGALLRLHSPAFRFR